ncbi:MAG: hypothetical protein ACRENP_16350, partial [Longimicrobiales bacterium]
PGEFRQLLNWSGSYRGDSIAAYDFVDRALEVFTPDGKFARALKLPRNLPTERPPRGTYGASEFFIGVFADGRVLRFEGTVLKVTDQPGQIYYQPDLQIYDANGASPRKLATLRTWGSWWDGRAAVEYVFQPMAVTIAGQEVWYHANGEDFTVQVFDTDGKLLRALHRPYTRVRVIPEDREALIRHRITRVRSSPREGGTAVAERVEKQLRTQARFAELKPIYTSMVEDAAQNLWVEHYRWIIPDDHGPIPRPGRWSVFASNGAFLGEVEVPASFIVSSITNDQVLGFWKDEFDVEHVRVYGLIKPGR